MTLFDYVRREICKLGRLPTLGEFALIVSHASALFADGALYVCDDIAANVRLYTRPDLDGAPLVVVNYPQDDLDLVAVIWNERDGAYRFVYSDRGT